MFAGAGGGGAALTSCSFDPVLQEEYGRVLELVMASPRFKASL